MRNQDDLNPKMGKQDMAWNEPGGNGDKDPWSSNRGNRGNQGPPDLDEVFSNLQKKFGSLFGGKGGPNPFWKVYDWNLALMDGAAYAGQTYTGEYEFVDTVMYLAVNHEIAPKEEAYGYNTACNDCHGDGQIDWTALGWTADPAFDGGTRP